MKQDIRFYDFDFNLIYIISDWISLNWDLKYNGLGTFELQLVPEGSFIQLLDDNSYLVAVQGNKQAIITGRMYDDEVTLYGRTPNWLLSKRIVMPFTMYDKKDIETIIYDKINDAFDEDDNLEMGTVSGDFEKLDEFSVTTPKDLLSFIIENLDEYNAGHRLTFEPLKHRWYFEIYCGEKKTLILSQANKNAYSPKYTHDILDVADGLCYKNTETNEYELSPSTNEGILRWYVISKSNNEEDAFAELKKCTENSNLTYESTLIEYGKDYNLGDTLYVETEFGGIKTRQINRVKSVRIWDEAINKGERPEFEQSESDSDND